MPTFSGSLLTWPLPAGDTLVRIHQINDEPIWFGPPPGRPAAYRFDAPAGQFRTLYAAQKLEGAFAETVLRKARRIVARAYVELRQWSVLQAQRDLVLVKLFDNGLAWHGVTADICSGDDYRASQALALALHATFPEIDGIAYRARHNNGQLCYALFDRVDSAHIVQIDARKFAHEQSLTDQLLRLHNASWDPLTPFPPEPSSP